MLYAGPAEQSLGVVLTVPLATKRVSPKLSTLHPLAEWDVINHAFGDRSLRSYEDSLYLTFGHINCFDRSLTVVLKLG
jgi:hypothetical protein